MTGVQTCALPIFLLLTILAVLTVWGLSVQKESAGNYYDIKNPTEIKMISTDNSKHWVDANGRGE